MNLKSAVAISLIMFTGLVSAQTATNIEPKPGFITASSPLYPVDTATQGLMSSPGETAYERASEYAVAKRQNNSQASERAFKQLNNSIAQVARSNSTQGLAKAEAVLTEVMNRTPEQANQGLSKALNNIQKARKGNLKPSDVGRPENMTKGKPSGVGSPGARP